MLVEQKYNNPLANSVYYCLLTALSSIPGQVLPITTPVIYKKVSQALGSDVRSFEDEHGKTASIFDGLDFDPNRTRTQAITIIENDRPIALLTFVIVPASEIALQRYLKLEGQRKRVGNFESIWNAKPSFLVVPGYTNVETSHRQQLKLALPGVRAIMNTLSLLKESSPPDTWMEIVAQGSSSKIQRQFINSVLACHQVGNDIRNDLSNIPENLFGINNDGSKSSMKLANLCGLKLAQNICSCPSLGPVFASEISKVRTIKL